ncbi:hypothetical protein EVAR_48338_1 [Eumeta japonica]|uniref:Uncharacterized protein n=1 Tax=Eumeta variegata TaxID=151549 RepID=A0A4C1WIG8_EUMVA|nr:hypothetical protein EVAR_48338_1 [Eumeta japonica]
MHTLTLAYTYTYACAHARTRTHLPIHVRALALTHAHVHVRRIHSRQLCKLRWGAWLPVAQSGLTKLRSYGWMHSKQKCRDPGKVAPEN